VERAAALRTSDGARIAYRLWRAAATRRPLIVLVHGLASNKTRWSELVERTELKRSWDILRMDLRGHEESPYRGRIDLEVFCTDLFELLDAEGYRDALVVGHSLGAHVALRAAALRPQRIRGLVLIDPVFGRPRRGELRWAARLRPLLRLGVWLVRGLNRLGIHRRRIPSRDLRALDEETRAELLAAGKQQEMIAKYASPWPDLRHLPTANLVQEILEMLRPLPDLAGTDVPVLLLLSRGVTYADPAMASSHVAGWKDVDVVTIDAHHWPLTERPDEVRRAIEEWCARRLPEESPRRA
jgi:esterase